MRTQNKRQRSGKEKKRAAKIYVENIVAKVKTKFSEAKFF